MTNLEKIPASFKKKFKVQTCKGSSEKEKELDGKHRSPNEKKLFKCNICKFSTTRKTYLNKNVHENDKCENCQTSFVQKIVLNTQKLTVHENKRPFNCDICQKCYGLKNSLNTHMTTVIFVKLLFKGRVV